MPKLYPPHVINENGIHSDDPVDKPDSKTYKKRFLAEGDSWFSQGAIPSSNLLYELELPYRSFILSLAKPGDEITRMSEFTRNKFFKTYLTDPKFTWKWDAILISGGGNDLIADVSKILVPGSGADPAAYVKESALKALQKKIVDGYSQIVDMRDSKGSINKNVEIFLHTYDRVTPRHAKALALDQFPVAGPWLIKRFEHCKILDSDLRDLVSDYMFDQVADTLVSIGGQLPKCIVVDTRDTLVRASPTSTKRSNDWLNEIHPTRGGYKKLGKRIAAEL